METISAVIGSRIKGFRKRKKLSQEQLAERCNLHPTYIGQLERGEKNATLESIQKVATGLDIPLEQLFININGISPTEEIDPYIPDRILFLMAELSTKEQKIIYDIIVEMLKLKA